MATKEEVLNSIKESIRDLKVHKGPLVYDFVADFYILLKEMLKDEQYKNEHSEIEKILDDLQVYRFRYYKTTKFYDFFASGFEKLLIQGLDANFIIDSIKVFNYQFWDFDGYKMSREKILNAIYQNKELLTKENIVYDNGKEESGSVKNWFKHYQISFDHNKDARLGLLEYMDKNKAVARLTSDEKSALRNLIYIIEYLRAPAEEVLMNEETMLIKDEDGSDVFIEDGKVTVYLPGNEDAQAFSEFTKNLRKVKSSASNNVVNKITDTKAGLTSTPSTPAPTPDLKQLIQLSESDLVQLKFVTQKYKSLNNEEVINYFWEGVEAYNLDMVLGAVQEMITRRQWDDFVVLPRLRLLIKDYNSRKQVVANMDEPRARLRLFFEWLLEEHLGLTDEKTKKWALYFSNLLLKNEYSQYKNLLVFDKQSQKLKWFET
ncbi:MAG TPA: hypothetical protein PLB38_03595 [bacterium]|nr:hypothetical protein [bacterium]